MHHSQQDTRRTYLLQAAQQHFIADHKNAVQRGQYKLLYPVVLYTCQQRLNINDLIHARLMKRSDSDKRFIRPGNMSEWNKIEIKI